MSLKRLVELTGATAAILAGVLWLASAWLGRQNAPRIDSAYDPTTPAESDRLKDVQTAGKFNTYAALAAALAAFAQGAALFLPRE